MVNQEVENMRVRTLRTKLIRRGEDPEEINAILDKKVLKKLLTERLWEEEMEVATVYYAELAWTVVKVMGAVALLALLWSPAWEFVQSAAYRNGILLHSARTAIKNGIYSAVLPFLLSIFLEGVHVWINATTLLGWVLPADSPIRLYFIPLPSLVANPKSLGFAAVDYGVNVSPMLVTMGVKWLQSTCQEFAAGRMIHVVEAKYKRRRTKEASKTAKREAQVYEDEAKLRRRQAAATGEGPTEPEVGEKEEEKEEAKEEEEEKQISNMDKLD
jgi:hypothetical protein